MDFADSAPFLTQQVWGDSVFGPLYIGEAHAWSTAGEQFHGTLKPNSFM